MDNSKYNSQQIKKICEKKLEIEFQARKHFKGWYKLNGVKKTKIIVPLGKKYVPKGTYKSMAQQLKLEVQEFDDLLKCPLSAEEYKEIIKDR